MYRQSEWEKQKGMLLYLGDRSGENKMMLSCPGLDPPGWTSNREDVVQAYPECCFWGGGGLYLITTLSRAWQHAFKTKQARYLSPDPIPLFIFSCPHTGSRL